MDQDAQQTWQESRFMWVLLAVSIVRIVAEPIGHNTSDACVDMLVEIFGAYKHDGKVTDSMRKVAWKVLPSLRHPDSAAKSRSTFRAI